MRTHNRERGASAVEFALIVPMLLILVLGIAEFGRAYNVQTTLSGAARAGVRVMALDDDAAAARTATKAAAAPAITLSDGQIAVTTSPATSPVSCSPGTERTVTLNVTYVMPFISNFFGSSITLKGRGVMRCSG